MELRAIWQVFRRLAIDSDSTFKFLFFTVLPLGHFCCLLFCLGFDSIWFDLISISISFFISLFSPAAAVGASAAADRTSALKSFVYSSGNQKVLLSKRQIVEGTASGLGNRTGVSPLGCWQLENRIENFLSKT